MIDFLKHRLVCYLFFAVVSLGVLGGYLYKTYKGESALTYSVEFTGGTQALLNFSNPVSSQTLEGVLESKWAGAVVREFSPTEYLIRVKEYSNDPQGLAESIKQEITSKISDNQVAIKSVDSVGPGIGADLRSASLLAILVALICMLIYIAWRFKSFAFGFGALAALFHDALVIIAIYMFFGFEISINVIAAILLILGYSINDTIVIFSRIRENIGKLKNLPIYDIVNISINETLKRSIYTSLSTALVVVALVIFGGPSIRALSMPFLIGIIFGTYSSIFVASPIMLLFYKENQ